MKCSPRHLTYFLILFCTLIAFALLSLVTGQSQLGFADLKDWITGSASSDIRFVFFNLRGPRTIAAIGVGAALSFSSVLLQTLLRNPLAEPLTLGISGGASLGAILIWTFLGDQWLWAIPLGAALGSLAVGGLLILKHLRQPLYSKEHLLLMGFFISFFCASIVTVLTSLNSLENPYQIVYWLTGHVGSERDAQSWILILMLLVVGVFLFIKKVPQALDQLLLGEPLAQSLGTTLGQISSLILLSTTLLTAFAVYLSGLVGFLGILAPQIALIIFKTRRHRILLVASSLVGAILFLSADVLGRVLIESNEIPAGSLVAIFSIPCLIFLKNLNASFWGRQ